MLLTRYVGEHVNEILKCTTRASGDIQEMLPFARKLKKNVKGELNFKFLSGCKFKILMLIYLDQIKQK